MPDDFKPVLFVYPQCPFCFKVRLFLLEAGLTDRVEIVEIEKGSEDEDQARERIGQHLEKVRFPTLQTGPEDFMIESDAIIAWFEDRYEVDGANFETLDVYVRGPFQSLRSLYRENKELKEKFGA